MIKFGLAGRYKITRRTPELDVVEESPWFNNIITNQGLDYIGETSYLYGCRVGAGSATPLATDTALQSSVAYTNVEVDRTDTYSNTSPYWSAIIITWRFAVGEAAGNLSEVGIFYDSDPNSCGSRALILDEFGDPTTITVLSNEILDVTYEARTYMLEDDITGSATIGEDEYDWTLRGALVAGGGQYGLFAHGASSQNGLTPCSGNIDTIIGEPTGKGDYVAYGSVNSYVSGTYKRSQVFEFGLERNNFDWQSLFFQTTLYTGFLGPTFQIQLDPVLEKTNTKVVTLLLEVSWARYAP